MDIERRLALTELLAQPDPPELRRGFTMRLEGKPDRFEMLPMLAAVFVQRKMLALEERRAERVPEPAVHAVAARPRPHAARIFEAQAA